MNRFRTKEWLKRGLATGLALAALGVMMAIHIHGRVPLARAMDPARVGQPARSARQNEPILPARQAASPTHASKAPDAIKVAAPPPQRALRDAAAVLKAVDAFLVSEGPADMKAIGRFLASTTPPPGWSRERMTAHKDEVLDRLSRLADPPGDMIQRLADVAGDVAADPAGRDYVLQYFREIYAARAAARTAWAASPEAETIRTAWTHALSQSSGTLAGTALLAWQAMAEGRPEFDRALAGRTALRLLTAPEASDATRTAALAVCAQAGDTAAVPRALQVAESGATLPLRAAAIAALGALGAGEQLAWLEAFRRDRAPPALQPACDAAIGELNRQFAAGK